MIVAVPPPTIVIVFPLIVTIPAGLALYDQAPELSEVGLVNSNGASPTTFGLGTIKAPIVGGASEGAL